MYARSCVRMKACGSYSPDRYDAYRQNIAESLAEHLCKEE